MPTEVLPQGQGARLAREARRDACQCFAYGSLHTNVNARHLTSNGWAALGRPGSGTHSQRRQQRGQPAAATSASRRPWQHRIRLGIAQRQRPDMTQSLSSDPTYWAATQIAAAVRDREVSIPEVTDCYLRRLQEISDFNALAWLDPEAVRRESVAAQVRLDRGKQAGLLAGVPFTVKDVIATGGVPSRAGSRALSTNIPGFDAPAVASIRRAGGILLAKSTCPEFALAITTESLLHGRTLSPWGSDLSPGGSSGGEAVLLACGGSALGLGTDFGGSLRWPAQCGGVLSLRPTVGRVSAAGQLPGLGGSVGKTDVLPSPATLQGRLQVIGPMARTVHDLEVGLSVLTALDNGHGYGAPPTAAGHTAEGLEAMPFMWCIGDMETACSADVVCLMQDVADSLRASGLKDTFMPDLLLGGCERYNRLRELDVLAEIRLATRGAESLVGAAVRALLERPTSVDAIQLSLAWESALEWRGRFLDRFEHAAVAIAPVAPGDATGHEGTLTVDGQRLDPWQLMAYCRAVSLTGLPVVSIPCGTSARGLPLSVQVIGRPFGEADVLAVASLLERALGGARLPLRPDVHDGDA